MELTQAQDKNKALAEELLKRSQVLTAKCYQCGKCSAGCPVANHMDLMPRQVIRLAQLGLVEDALKSKTIWLCASCDTCSSRCPKEVDVAKVMETLRIMAKERGYINEPDMNKFHDIFLGSVKSFGRVHEVGLIIQRNLKTMKLFQDAQFGMPMLAKGKISIMPHKIKATDDVKKIFANAEKYGKGGQH